ncbi:hypothetical protein GA0115253_1066417, partial [Streptomyces sp. Termitarium-T10T-6]
MTFGSAGRLPGLRNLSLVNSFSPVRVKRTAGGRPGLRWADPGGLLVSATAA